MVASVNALVEEPGAVFVPDHCHHKIREWEQGACLSRPGLDYRYHDAVSSWRVDCCSQAYQTSGLEQ